MRVRISYQPDGAITPCGPASYGETEDYTINITSGAGLNDNPLGLVQMYPNPAQDLVYIDFKNLSENGLIEILDVNGKILSQTTGLAGQINTVGIAQLANGLYHVRMSANGQQFTQRLIKN
jgi:hypothetical protein